MSNKNGSKWLRPSTRLAVYARDRFCCIFCARRFDLGAQGLTVDHWIPHKRGGSNHPSNLLTVCLSCNSAKEGRSVRWWFARLRDRGVNTRLLQARIRRRLKQEIDRELGRWLLQERRKLQELARWSSMARTEVAPALEEVGP